jgi:hypothetical protein
MVVYRGSAVILFGGLLVLLAPARAEAQRRCRVSEIQIIPSQAEVRVGATYPFVANAYDAAGNVCDVTSWRWTSSNPRAVTIDAADGIATGVAVGVSIITASTGTGAARRQGQAILTVTTGAPAVQAQTEPPPDERPAARPAGAGYAAFERQPDGSGPAEALYVNPLRVVLVRGERLALEYRAYRADGGLAQRVPIIFTVQGGGERLIAVDSFGVITSLGDTGTAVVQAAVPGNSRIPPRLVNVQVRADEIRFNRTVISISPGAVETLSVYIPAQERALNHEGLFQFTSSDTSVVKVNVVRPIIEGAGPGSARVTAQSSIYPELQVTVNVHRPVTALRIAPPDSILTVAIGGTLTLRAEPLAADTSVVREAPVRWQAPDTNIVAFDAASGTLRGRAVGITQIVVNVPTRGDRALVRTIRVRVVAGGLAVNRERVGLPVGGRTPVSVNLLDDRRQPIGPAQQLRWSSSNDSVAVYRDGEIRALRPGRASITARTDWDSTVTVDVNVVGDVVVTAQRQGVYDLWMLWTGGPPIPLTRDSAFETFPSWSPDMTRLAYSRAFRPVDQVSELYVMNVADGSEARAMTRDSSQVRFIAWVPPRGERLVYESTRGGTAQIWVINADGTGARAVTQGPLTNQMPAVSPDGSRLLYVGLRETSPGRRVYSIMETNLDGSGTPRELLPGSQGTRLEQPQYAPDGQNILFLRDEGTARAPVKRIYRLRRGAPADSLVALTPASSYIASYAPSADGRTIVCGILEFDANSQVRASRVQVFNLAIGTFADLAGAAAEERLTGPALRPGYSPAVPGTAAPSR